MCVCVYTLVCLSILFPEAAEFKLRPAALLEHELPNKKALIINNFIPDSKPNLLFLHACYFPLSPRSIFLGSVWLSIMMKFKKSRLATAAAICHRSR